MILMVLLSCIFFATIIFIIVSSFIKIRQNIKKNNTFLPKSRTEMVKGLATIAIVFSHIASYSKNSASSGLLRYYNLFCTSLGGIGVNLFFFFSGYGNYFSIITSEKQRIKWFWKRCFTLLIVYVTCLGLVLGALYLNGYRTTIGGIFSELVHLTIPYSSVWYVKMQLLLYVFLLFSMLLKNRNYQIITVTLLSLLSTIFLYGLGMEEKWWKSTLCFAAGIFVAVYKQDIEKVFFQYKNIILIGNIILFPFAYVCAIFIDMYSVKVIGNLVLCIVMVGIVQLLQMDNRIYYKLGEYSLTLYLVHRSLVAWILDDGETTIPKVAIIVIYSALFTVIAKRISDIIVNKCFVKGNNDIKV